MCSIPYYLWPWGWCQWRLYGGTAGLWSGVEKIHTGGGVSSGWLWSQDHFCWGSAFLVVLQWLITLVNTQTVSVANIVDPSSIQRAETKYCLRIKFLALVVMIHEVRLNAWNRYWEGIQVSALRSQIMSNDFCVSWNATRSSSFL